MEINLNVTCIFNQNMYILNKTYSALDSSKNKTSARFTGRVIIYIFIYIFKSVTQLTDSSGAYMLK